jgi:hypothetical protein
MFRTAIAYQLPSGWPWDAAGTAEQQRKAA